MPGVRAQQASASAAIVPATNIPVDDGGVMASSATVYDEELKFPWQHSVKATPTPP